MSKTAPSSAMAEVVMIFTGIRVTPTPQLTGSAWSRAVKMHAAAETPVEDLQPHLTDPSTRRWLAKGHTATDLNGDQIHKPPTIS